MKGLTISEIDKNFEIKSENYKDTRYFDALDEPFSLYGVFYENGAYNTSVTYFSDFDIVCGI